MEAIISLAFGALNFLLFAFVITVVVHLGPWLLGSPTRAEFWKMFRVTCVILLILGALA